MSLHEAVKLAISKAQESGNDLAQSAIDAVRDWDRRIAIGDKKFASNAGKETFETFWLAYPKKIGKSACLTKWLKLKLDDQKAAIQALPAHVAKWDDPKYIPHPITWINQRRWEDEIEPVATEDNSRFWAKLGIK